MDLPCTSIDFDELLIGFHGLGWSPIGTPLAWTSMGGSTVGLWYSSKRPPKGLRGVSSGRSVGFDGLPRNSDVAPTVPVHLPLVSHVFA